ncbi:hypothetical protein [Enterococcus faecalis]|uniref:hypothetical protein n=1 Tax=Enterococcus faecalis TaxID=1351 RepID=UPI0020325EF9|nr:hypothetical protein [Enterococcus faecalis]
MAKEKNEKKANSDKGEIKETNLKKCFFITPIGEKNSNEFKKLKAIVEKNELCWWRKCRFKFSWRRRFYNFWIRRRILSRGIYKH